MISDCAGLVRKVAGKYGDKVLQPSSAARVDHIDHFTDDRNNDVLVLRTTFAEHFLFAMTDFQVKIPILLLQH